MTGRATPGLIGSARWNLVAFACGLAANLLTVPFVVRAIGLDAFGLAGLVIAVCAPFLVVGTVLGQALVREMSSRIGAGDAAGADRFLPAALKLCALAGAVGWLLLVLGGPAVVGWISDPGVGADELRLIFAIAATGWLAQQFALVFQGASTARMNYRAVAKVSAVYAAASAAMILAFTHLFPSALAFVTAVSAGYGVLLLGWCVALRHLRWLGGGRDETRALVHFSGWQSVAHVISAFSIQIDRYLLGALAPMAVVGGFNIAKRVQEAGSIGVLKAGEVLFPRFGSLSTAPADERARFFRFVGWSYSTLAATVLIPTAMLAEPLLTLWIGAGHVGMAATMLTVLSVAGLMGTGSDVYTYAQMSSGDTRSIAVISTVAAAVTIAISIPAIWLIGPVAAGLGLLIASTVRIAMFVVWLRPQSLPRVTLNDTLIAPVIPIVVGIAVLALVASANLAWIDGWTELGACFAALAGIVAAAIIAVTATMPGGREVIAAFYHRFLRPRRA